MMTQQAGRHGQDSTSDDGSNPCNFVASATPGCHVVAPRDGASDWIFGWQDVDPQDYDEHLPDIAVDPATRILSVCNVQEAIVAQITVHHPIILRNRHGQVLASGTSTDAQGTTRNCTTLIVPCPPRTMAHVCLIEFAQASDLCNVDGESDSDDWSDVEESSTSESEFLERIASLMESDVQPLRAHANPSDMHAAVLECFPLRCNGASFQCTQGEGGHFTHFFAGNYHALDFACPVGTPLVAVAPGTVTNIHMDISEPRVVPDDEKREFNATPTSLTGIAVSNLYRWNSIMLQLDTTFMAPVDDGPLFVEYVHIHSACVQVGDVVQAGQVIGFSGQAGFCPEPHLHFSAFRSAARDAPTVRVHFKKLKQGAEALTTAWSMNDVYLPRAGLWYNNEGPVSSGAE
jgi:Peptidase family M23